MAPTATTRLLAILGDPVAHSISPAMHNAACAALGLDAVYVPLRVAAEDLPTVLAAFRAVGGAGNVTVPHKPAVAALVDELTDRAARLGVVNTFWMAEGRLCADNTDVEGVLAATEGMGAPWVILGTGGAARAAVEAARERGVPVGVRSRDPVRAAAFVTWARELGVGAVWVADAIDEGATIINATPVGLRADDPLPIDAETVARAGAVMDMVYRPGTTPLVRAARDAGVQAVDGRAMVIAQAAVAFERFFPGVQAPREIFGAAAHRALE